MLQSLVVVVRVHLRLMVQVHEEVEKIERKRALDARLRCRIPTHPQELNVVGRKADFGA